MRPLLPGVFASHTIPDELNDRDSTRWLSAKRPLSGTRSLCPEMWAADGKADKLIAGREGGRIQ